MPWYAPRSSTSAPRQQRRLSSCLPPSTPHPSFCPRLPTRRSSSPRRHSPPSASHPAPRARRRRPHPARLAWPLPRCSRCPARARAPYSGRRQTVMPQAEPPAIRVTSSEFSSSPPCVHKADTLARLLMNGAKVRPVRRCLFPRALRGLVFLGGRRMLERGIDVDRLLVVAIARPRFQLEQRREALDNFFEGLIRLNAHRHTNCAHVSCG